MKISESQLRNLIRSRLLLEEDDVRASGGGEGHGSERVDRHTRRGGRRGGRRSRSPDGPAPGSVGETSGTATVDTLNPSAKSKFEDFIAAASEAGYSIKINSTWRAPSHQWNLKYTNRGALTPAKPCRSDHQYGYAMDINFSYQTNDGRTVNVTSRDPDSLWQPLVDIAAEKGISWQGRKDRVHFYVSAVPSSQKDRCTQFYSRELGSNPQEWGSEYMKEMEMENTAEIADILDVPESAFQESEN